MSLMFLVTAIYLGSFLSVGFVDTAGLVRSEICVDQQENPFHLLKAAPEPRV